MSGIAGAFVVVRSGEFVAGVSGMLQSVEPARDALVRPTLGRAGRYLADVLGVAGGNALRAIGDDCANGEENSDDCGCCENE